MADIWPPKKRSEVMSLIRSENTQPELAVRRIVFGLGYRYRVNSKKIVGRPDISILKHKVAIFIHGCFWHFHGKCRDGKVPGSNRAYWRPKLTGNKKRDIRNRKKLRTAGWKVLTLWECEIKKRPQPTAKKINTFLTFNIVKLKKR